MAIEQLHRQWPLAAVFEVSQYDFTGTDPYVVGHLPSGALVVSGFAQAKEAFDVSNIAINAGSALTFGSVTAGSTGRVVATSPGIVSGHQAVTVTRDASTDSTGILFIVIQYVIPGKQNEVQQ